MMRALLALAARVPAVHAHLMHVHLTRAYLMRAAAGCRAFCAAALVGLCAVALPAMAQNYPSRAITWIVSLPAGGGTDFMSRTVAEQMGKSLGQAIVIDNRPGASGAIGMSAAARANPDGYTLVTGENGSLTVNPHLFPKLPYDPSKDFQPVGLFAKVPFLLLVNPTAVPVGNFREFTAYAKKNPGKVTYGSFGPGSISHLMGELLQQRAGVVLTHVPYKGGAPAMQDLLRGEIDALFIDYSLAKQYLDNGTLKALAVTTRERHPGLPDVPSLQELGLKDYDVASWMGLMAPAKTPKPVIDRLAQSLAQALQSPEVTQAFAARGILKWPGSAADFHEAMVQESARWGALVKQAGIKVE
jgi:tripartite-type tricarboxylate transporter receptor subunit TctC